MLVHPAVIVHGLKDARVALAAGHPVTLLSAPGAAQFAGCLWWREVVAAAHAEYSSTDLIDILDCADASGAAMGALRSGVARLVLWPEAPGWHRVAGIAQRLGGFVWPTAPPALDLAHRGASRQLHNWLRGVSSSAG